MSLESATYISSLSPSAPAAGDPKSQGDDHLRLIKQVLQNTLPNSSGPFYFPSTVAAQTSALSIAAPTDAGKIIPANAAAGAFTVTLPTTDLFDGFSCTVVKSDFSLNQVTIDGNGKTINGVATQLLVKAFQKIRLVYSSTLAAWIGEKDRVIETGVFMDSAATSMDGYLLCDGVSTIGDGSSGAIITGVFTQALFTLLWNQFADGVCAVSTGRGANAAADYAAHKKITLPDLRGRTRFGKDDMGGTAASRITTLAGNVLGTSGGSQSSIIVQSDLPNVTISLAGTGSGTGTTSTGGVHGHPWRATNSTNDTTDATGGIPLSSGGFAEDAFTGTPSDARSETIGGGGSHSHTVSVTVSVTGNTSSINGNVAQTGLNNMPPMFITNTFIAL